MCGKKRKQEKLLKMDLPKMEALRRAPIFLANLGEKK
jgi:hypothetical protein